MRGHAIRVLCLIVLAVQPIGARAASEATAAKPSSRLIVSIAQQFVLEHFKRSPENHFDIAFDIARIHPQPEPDYWAVIGGFMADAGGSNYRPHAFGVAMRLICPDYDDLRCWKLEKLVIDQTIILNN